MRTLLDRLFAAAGYLAGLFLIGTLLAVLASIFGRLIPALDLPAPPVKRNTRINIPRARQSVANHIHQALAA